jgi:hypothetical protein
MTQIEREQTPWNDAMAPASRLCRTDSVTDLLRDCTQMGLLDELRERLQNNSQTDHRDTIQVVRDLVYELAGAHDRDLAVDVLIHATGVAEFDHVSLRDYARKHGLSHEGFRKQVLAMQRRLNLPRRPMPPSDAN